MLANTNLILIFVCLIVGVLLNLSGKFPKNAPQAFNLFVIWISLPALVLTQIPPLIQNTTLNFELLIPMSMAWLTFPISFFLFYNLGRYFKWPNADIGALVLTAGLANTSFVGLPLLESLMGTDALPIGILVDQLGSFLVLSTLGIFAATTLSPFSGKEFQLSVVLKKTAVFPPFVALFLAIVWGATGHYQPGPMATVLSRLASTLVPLAILAVGMQLKLSREVITRHWRALAMGLSFRLVLMPAFFTLLYMFVFSSRSFSTQVTVLESAMAPMITSGVVAEEFGFNTEISNLMICIGIPLSIFTVYIWHSLIS